MSRHIEKGSRHLSPLQPCRTRQRCNGLIHNTGHVHGVLPAHVGMRVRFTQKINASAGLVQEQKGSIVEFVFEPSDMERYKNTRPGEVFRPKSAPASLLRQYGFYSSQVETGIFRSSFLLRQVHTYYTQNIHTGFHQVAST